MLDLIAGFILEVFLWGTGAVLIKVFTLNRCNPRDVGQNAVAILGMVFWVLVVLFLCGQIV